MSEMRQLSPQEVLFVGGETPTVYQHTSGLTTLDASDRPGFGYETFRQILEERLDQVPQFRWRLHEVPLGLDLPYWVEDESFSFDHHLRRIAVPSPGDDRALGELVAYLYSRHMDRSRPLWEIWFIEGLPDGQFAFFTKLHHCMMDGEGANQLGALMTDLEPDAPPREIDAAIAGARAGETPPRWRASANAAWHLAGLPVRAGREVADLAWRAVSRPLTGSGASRERPHAPRTIFNCEISGERGFVFGSVPLADVKAVKNHFDVTVNDVILALVGGSLRRYLRTRDELPDASLRTSIAVSLRSSGDHTLSNQVTTAGVTLATDIAEPAERLRAIARESEQAKEDARGGAKGLLELVAILPPVLVNAVMSATPPELVPWTTGFNLMVSNVRGSPIPLYMGGLRTTGMYPMSIIAPGGALNVTCISYVDEIDVGITTEPNVVTDPWTLVEGLHDELEGYLALLPDE